MKLLSLTIDNIPIPTPSGIPTGGLSGEGGVAINIAIQLIFVVGIALAVAFVIISGIQWIISGGDKTKLQAARGRLTYAIVGLVVILGAFVIINTVISLLGGTQSLFS